MIPFQPAKLVVALAAVLPSFASVSALAQEATAQTPPAKSPATNTAPATSAAPATPAPATNVRASTA